MLSKIAISTIKHRIKDFIILFTGLSISVAIFFMFTTIASNKAFLESNSDIRQIALIFIVGEFLLGFITIIYLTFANTFLLQLRQREYGLLMMYGATKKQVSNLLFRETMILGVLSSIVGIVFGMALTSIAGSVLQNLLYLNLPNWQFFNIKGLIITLLFFLIVLFANGSINAIHLRKTQLDNLLQANQVNEKLPRHIGRYIILGLLGLLLFIASILVMKNVVNYGIAGLITALVLNVSGTYLIIRASLILILSNLKKLNHSYKGLNRFTLGQLTFRLGAFDKLLTIVTLMFALALGSLSVGRAYQLTTPIIAKQSSAYTIAIKNATATDKKNINKLKEVTFLHTYQYKSINDGKVYFDQNEFNKVNLPVLKSQNKFKNSDLKIPTTTYANVSQLQTTYASSMHKLSENALSQSPLMSENIEIVFVSNATFNSLRTATNDITVIRVDSISKNEYVLSQLVDSQKAKLDPLAYGTMSGTYPILKTLRGFMGGLEFMGFFLAVAFLSMLASTLMFKVLSNAATDKQRYRILSMVGANKRLLRLTNAKEIAIIFSVPLILGFIDVWFGLTMFQSMLSNVYLGFGFASLTIITLYALYYFVTVKLYQRLLNLPKY